MNRTSAAGATAPIGEQRLVIVLPSLHDPRLRLSAVIITLQILGQAVLNFKVSVAQILVSIGVAAVIEVGVSWRRARVLAWPASAILTGNSVAFILRASGTRHGDWWTLHGVQYFVIAVVLSLLSKYLIRVRGCHVFNPSNLGLVWTLLVIGPVHVFPQYLWWGPLGLPLTLALIVILAGAVWVLTSVRMTIMALAFLIPFAALVGLFAVAGQSFLAIWHSGPVSGSSYWRDICLSPEVLIFVFFMMSDPKTAPRGTRAQLAFGVGTAVLAAGLLLLQPTEFGIKVAILASLTVTCALRPLVDGVAEFVAPRDAAPASALRGRMPRARSLAAWSARGLRVPAVLAAMIIAIAAPADTIALRGDTQISYIEQGLTGRNPQ